MSDEIVSFKRTPEDIEDDRRMEESGATGHPNYMVWFCPKHIEAARKLQHLTVSEALKKLR